MQTTHVIITHPQRLSQAQTLAHQVTGTLCVDDNQYGPGVNHDRALHQALHQATSGWIVLLEDDAQPIPQYLDQLHQALTAAPSPAVSLYLGTGRPRAHQHHIPALLAQDPHWIIHQHLRHAVAVALHLDLAKQLPNLLTNTTGDADKRLGQAINHLGYHIAYINPSIVDHADDTPTITHINGTPRPRPEPRHAWHTGTRTHWSPHNTTTL